MKVITKDYAGRERTMCASDAFTPDTVAYEVSGQLEEAEARARKACEALGRLLEFMLEARIVTLEQAKEISGVHHYGVRVAVD